MKLKTLKPRLPSLGGSRLPKLLASTNRMTGRAAVDRRDRYLRLHPLCRECDSRNQVAAAEVVDHRIPLWAGGEDDYEANGQSLCHPHHDAKTACEARMRAAGGWLAAPCSCGQHGQDGLVA